MSAPRGRRWRRVAVVALTVALALVAVAAAVVGMVAGTTPGLRWTLDRLEPLGFSAGGAQGRLLGSVRLTDIAFEGGGFRLTVDRVRIDWRPSRLVSRTLALDDVALDGVRLVLPDSLATTDWRSHGGGWSSPVRLQLRRATVRDLRVVTPEADTVRLAGAAVAGGLIADTVALDSLRLRGLAVRGVGLDLDLSGRIAVGDDHDAGRIELAGAWNGTLPDGRPAAGTLRVDGDRTLATVRHRLTGPMTVDLTGRVRRAFQPDMDADAHVQAHGTHPRTGAAELDARLAFHSERLTLDSARVRLADAADLVLTGSVDLSGSAEFRFAGDGVLRGPSLPETRVTLGATGRHADARLEVEDISASLPATGATLAGSAAILLGPEPSGQATLRWRDLGWPVSDPVNRSSRGELTVAGSAAHFEGRVAARVAGGPVPAGDWDLRFQGALVGGELDLTSRLAGGVDGAPPVTVDTRLAYHPADRHVRLDALRLRVPGTAARLDGTGSASLVPGGVDGALRLTWADLAGRLPNGDSLGSPAGSLLLTARAADFGLRADLAVGGTSIPAGRWRLRGRGTSAGFVLESLDGEMLDGEIRGAGSATRGEGVDWTLSLRGAGLDPGARWAAWPGALDFDAVARGHASGERLAFELDRLGVSGTLRDRPVEAGVRGSGTDRSIRLDTLFLRSGTATLDAAGSLGDAVALGLRLDAADLADLAPGLTGSARLGARARGETRRPAVDLHLEGHDLGMAEARVRDLAVRAGVEPSGVGWLEIDADSVAAGGVELDSARVAGDGTFGAHRLTLDLHSPTARLTGSLRGEHHGAGWDGALDALELGSGAVGDWSLERPARLWLAADSVRLDSLCWAGTGRFCAAGAWGRESGASWSATGADVPLGFLGPALPPGLDLRGTVAIDTRGRFDPAGPAPAGEIRVTGGPGEVAYVERPGREAVQPYDGFEIRGASDVTGLTGGFELRLRDLGAIRGSAAASGSAPLAERPLRGELTGELRDGGALGRMVEDLSDSRGTLRLAVGIGGTGGAPAVRGTIVVDSGGAVVEPMGIHVQDVRLELAGEDARTWRIHGSAVSGSGSMTLGGVAVLPRGDSAASLEATLTGERFELARTTLVQAAVSPALRIAAGEGDLRVQGDVTVPRARITAKDVELAVAPSPDIVILGPEVAGQEREAARAAGPPRLHANVRVGLGDDVRIDARGLRGRLAGAVTVTATPERPPVGTGELRVVDGRYRIYRQTFQIERGRLLYAGNALTEPALDLRIARRGGDVLAGMNVGGTVEAPEVELFSEPALGDDEILAYLIAGRPLSRLSRSEGNMIRNAAESAGVAGGNLLLARLNTLFSLGEARLERGADASGSRTTSLVLGRKVLPRVHVGYAVALAGSSNVLRIRYVVGRGFVLQTESGAETGADLLYTIER